MADSEVYHGAIKETEHLVAAPAARSVTILRHPGSFLSGGMPELIVPFAQYSGIGGIQQSRHSPRLILAPRTEGSLIFAPESFACSMAHSRALCGPCSQK